MGTHPNRKNNQGQDGPHRIRKDHEGDQSIARSQTHAADIRVICLIIIIKNISRMTIHSIPKPSPSFLGFSGSDYPL